MAKRKQSAESSGGGAKTVRLSKAAFKQVEKNATAIAAGLMDGALNGNCTSIRLLVALAKAGPDAKKSVEAHPLLGLAMRLKAEPEMRDNATDARSADERPTQN
jgi:hypothetical protein